MDIIKGGLVVSCQALEHEPLHSSFIMSKMAKAAVLGGAIGIRANTVADIREIKKEVDVPIIGIIKRDYPNSSVYITPTMVEVDELTNEKVDIIAIDATSSIRPDGKTLCEFISMVKEKYPNQLLMADCSTYKEAVYASKIGFDFIGTTLFGYTEQSKNYKIHSNDFEIIKKLIKDIDLPIIAEGNIDSPKKYKRLLELGVHCVVVGSIITRPQYITERFTKQKK